MCDCAKGIDLNNMEDLYSAKLPSPVLLNFFKDLENRILWVDFDITDGLIEFEKYIIKWNKDDFGIPKEERKPIKILIYSYGGDVDSIMSFIDVIQISKTPIHTFNMGQALSAGALLFIAGHKRFAMPNSQVLIHAGGVNGVSGGTNSVIEMVDNIKEIQKAIEVFIIENTNIDKKTYTKFSKKEWYINVADGVKYGIIDEIISDIDILF